MTHQKPIQLMVTPSPDKSTKASKSETAPPSTPTTSAKKDGSVSSNNPAVRVFVRVRNTTERQSCVEVDSGTQLTIACKPAPKSFSFDGVFDTSIQQSQVYASVAIPVLERFLDGYNGCLFAYGQTGSGKTYTMFGDGSAPGIVPRLCGELFTRISASRRNMVVHASFLEIYAETVLDLVGTLGTLKIMQDSNTKEIVVDNLARKEINSSQDLMQLVAEGTKKRHVAETNMNAVSSRSHAVLTLYLEQREAGDEENLCSIKCKLNLVDLAGSERADSTGATGQQLREGALINKSLSTLGMVINALGNDSNAAAASHVPYRDSKLTRLLQDSLGGSAYTTVVACVSPVPAWADESVSTLRFAERAKKMKNSPKIARDPMSQKMAELLEENRLLKERVQELEEQLGLRKKKGCCTGCSLM
jgi:hypothetical protein